jgi:hypothetical protein
MRTPRKTTRGTAATTQQQSNLFKTSLRAWQARYKEQRATQLTGAPAAAR